MPLLTLDASPGSGPGGPSATPTEEIIAIMKSTEPSALWMTPTALAGATESGNALAIADQNMVRGVQGGMVDFAEGVFVLVRARLDEKTFDLDHDSPCIVEVRLFDAADRAAIEAILESDARDERQVGPPLAYGFDCVEIGDVLQFARTGTGRLSEIGSI